VLFAFEEAIGYMCDPENVLDKDGISAMAVGAELCAYLKTINRTLYEQLDYISLLYGYHINENSYVLCHKADIMHKLFDRLRHYDRDAGRTPQSSGRASEKIVEYSNKIKSHMNIGGKPDDTTYVYPKSCGRYQVTGIRDLTVGIEVDYRTNSDRQPELPSSMGTQMLTFYFDNGCEITIRASGTEPKIKWYSEIRKKPSNTNENQLNEQFRQETRDELHELVETCVEEFLQPKKNELIERETSRK